MKRDGGELAMVALDKLEGVGSAVALPSRCRDLAVYDGARVPWSVAWVESEPRGGPASATAIGAIATRPDFRQSDAAKVVRCIEDERCLVCGGPLGRFRTFVLTTMSIVNGLSSEPPCHRECAEWWARVTPIADGRIVVAWTSRSSQPFRADGVGLGVLYRIGEPLAVRFYRGGVPVVAGAVLEEIGQGSVPLLVSARERDAAFAAEVAAKADNEPRPVAPDYEGRFRGWLSRVAEVVVRFA